MRNAKTYFTLVLVMTLVMSVPTMARDRSGVPPKVRVVSGTTTIKVGKKVLAEVSKGDVLDIVKEVAPKGGWVYVQFRKDGQTVKGWILASQVTRIGVHMGILIMRETGYAGPPVKKLDSWATTALSKHFGKLYRNTDIEKLLTSKLSALRCEVLATHGSTIRETLKQRADLGGLLVVYLNSAMVRSTRQEEGGFLSENLLVKRAGKSELISRKDLHKSSHTAPDWARKLDSFYNNYYGAECVLFMRGMASPAAHSLAVSQEETAKRGKPDFVKLLKDALQELAPKIRAAVQKASSSGALPPSKGQPKSKTKPKSKPPAAMTKVPKYLTLDLGKGVTMKLVLIPAGTFTMGSPKTEKGRSNGEGPQHEVTISKPFYMGVTEVTQEQYEAVVGKNPAEFKGMKNPVEKVSWDDAVAFCKALSKKTGKSIHLPTEAEWEYACRAGTKTAFCFGDDAAKLDDYAWYRERAWEKDNGTMKSQPVAQKKPNVWGLYDMHGNVWEWCSDRYSLSYANGKAVVDPQGAPSGRHRVLRGGSWRSPTRFRRSAHRYANTPDSGSKYYGFRVVVVSGSGMGGLLPAGKKVVAGGTPPAKPARSRTELDYYTLTDSQSREYTRMARTFGARDDATGFLIGNLYDNVTNTTILDDKEIAQMRKVFGRHLHSEMVQRDKRVGYLKDMIRTIGADKIRKIGITILVKGKAKYAWPQPEE